MTSVLDDQREQQKGTTTFETSFWQVCWNDFPHHRKEVSALIESGSQLADGRLAGGVRAFEKLCAGFFDQHSVPWLRYEHHLAYWEKVCPTPPSRFADDDEDLGPDTREMGKLLAHRILMAHLTAKRRLQYLGNIDHRPVWRLVPIADGRAYPQCLEESTQLHHCLSVYWKDKQIPCEQLDCRCDVTALTLNEAVQFEG
jgi:hypothetical protein